MFYRFEHYMSISHIALIVNMVQFWVSNDVIIQYRGHKIKKKSYQFSFHLKSIFVNLWQFGGQIMNFHLRELSCYVQETVTQD